MSDYTLEEVIDFIKGEIDTAYEAAYYEGGCEDCDDPIECLKEKLKKKIEDDEIKFIKASELEDLIDDCIEDSDNTDDADEDDTADECGSSCNETVDNIISAYELGLITYEDADAYLSLMTEARRLDKEILKRNELLKRYYKIADDPDIPKTVKDKMYNKVASQTELRSPTDRYLPSEAGLRHQRIRDAVKDRKHGTNISVSLWNNDFKPAEERKPGKYLELQKKLNNNKTDLALPKKVNTKVPKEDYFF